MMQKPVIYLNRIKAHGQDVLALYFDLCVAIEERIAQNDWISWNIEHQCHTVLYKRNTVGLLKDVFDDIAVVSTQYFDASLKANAGDINIGNGSYFRDILPQLKKMGTVTLVPYKDDFFKAVVIR